MPTDPPADVYKAARAMFQHTATSTAEALEARANGETYTLTFGPIIDRVSYLVWLLAHEKKADHD